MNIFCPCREPQKLDESSIPSLINEEECYFPLASLLFCTECHAIRCPYCTVKEPVSWYCSQCLLETTKNGAAESSNRCLRNCLRCPRCKSNIIVKSQKAGAEYSTDCSLCEYKYNLRTIKGMGLAEQVRRLRKQEFSNISSRINRALPPYLRNRESAPYYDAYKESRNKRQLSSEHQMNDTEAIGEHIGFQENEKQEEPPLLVPLRAKYKKMCKACGYIMAEADRHPAKVKYLVKSIARSFLPAIEIHKVEDTFKLVVRNFSTSQLNVQLASLNPLVSVPVKLNVPPLSSTDGFRAPLFLVERDSIESKQAFMSGAKNSIEGPGWAVSDIDLDGFTDDLSDFRVITLFISAAHNSAKPVGAWIKLKVPPNIPPPPQ